MQKYTVGMEYNKYSEALSDQLSRFPPLVGLTAGMLGIPVHIRLLVDGSDRERGKLATYDVPVRSIHAASCCAAKHGPSLEAKHLRRAMTITHLFIKGKYITD
jgi:hypothetical protein